MSHQEEAAGSPGKEALLGKRNQDLAVKWKIFVFVKLPWQNMAVCDQIIPHSVQIDPMFSYHAWSGIFF